MCPSSNFAYAILTPILHPLKVNALLFRRIIMAERRVSAQVVLEENAGEQTDGNPTDPNNPTNPMHHTNPTNPTQLR
jgi:hypothetical protein